MIELFVAFGAGLISFLSPCVLPLIPGYISYISGSSLKELTEKKNVNLIPIILFTLGFSIVFIVFGAASTFLGQVLLQNSYELRVVAGLIIIILGTLIISSPLCSSTKVGLWEAFFTSTSAITVTGLTII